MRFRTIRHQPRGIGTSCPAVKAMRNCNTRPCPVDCNYTWHPWTSCSKTCGGGVQSRTAKIDRRDAHGGLACPKDQDRICSTAACPTPAPTPLPTVIDPDCQVTEWSSWSMCSEECGSGVKMRFRKITKSAQRGGAACPSLKSMSNCNTQACPVDCKYEWSGWSLCSVSCGQGMQSRKAIVSAREKHGGMACRTTA